MLEILNTVEEYINFTSDGQLMNSGDVYYVREDNSAHFITNNVDGNTETFNAGGEVPNYLYGAAIYVKYNKTKPIHTHICYASATQSIDYIMIDGQYISGEEIQASHGQYELEDGEHEAVFILNTKEIPNSFFNINSCSDMIEKVVVSDYYTSLGNYFLGSTTPNLKKVVLGNHLITIGEEILGSNNEDYNIQINIPDSVETIGNSAYRYSHLKNAEFPNTIESIGSSAFAYSDELEEVNIPDSESTITVSSSAFANCPKLKKVYLGKGVTLSSSSVFDYCHIEEATFNTNVGYNYTGDKSNSLRKLVLEKYVTEVSSSSYTQCKALETILINSDSITVANFAFNYNPKLKEVIINSPSSSLGNSVFNGCPELTTFIVAEGCTKLGQECLRDNPKLTELVLPSTITSIGKWCFSSSGIKSLTVKATTPPSAGGVLGLNNDCIIYVPSESVNAYKAASRWSAYADNIQAIA